MYHSEAFSTYTLAEEQMITSVCKGIQLHSLGQTKILNLAGNSGPEEF